jgi:hypothetical protein
MFVNRIWAYEELIPSTGTLPTPEHKPPRCLLTKRLSRFFLFLSSFFSADINANRSLSLSASYVQPRLALVVKKLLEEFCVFVLMPNIDQSIEEDNWYE